MNECVEAISQIDAFAWGALGSMMAFGAVKVAPWARASIKKKASHAGSLSIDVLALIVMVVWLVLVGVVATLIGEPTSAKDAVVWGLGGQGLVAGIVPGAPQGHST